MLKMQKKKSNMNFKMMLKMEMNINILKKLINRKKKIAEELGIKLLKTSEELEKEKKMNINYYLNKICNYYN